MHQLPLEESFRKRVMDESEDVHKSTMSLSCEISVKCNIWVENLNGLFVKALV